MLVGFAPAALLGIPGLIGLAAAIVVGLGFIAFFKYKKISASGETPGRDAVGHGGLLLFGRAGDVEIRLSGAATAMARAALPLLRQLESGARA